MDEQLYDVARELGELRGIAEGGFAAICERLDKLNGTVARHDKEIRDQQAALDKAKGAYWLLSIIGSLFMLALGAYAEKLLR